MELSTITTEAKNILSFIEYVLPTGFLETSKLNELKHGLEQALTANNETKIIEMIAQTDLFFEECGNDTISKIKETLPTLDAGR
ncbi:MAG: hypothetical protein ABII18_11160 [bacterium]|nr:hypothetical protein [bacterium]MBU1918410.1 hypothetical protein [bacterium]